MYVYLLAHSYYITCFLSEDYSIYVKGLDQSMITVQSIIDDPFNVIWTEGRPPMVNEPIYVHPLEFAG